jgi:hypothetical protein
VILRLQRSGGALMLEYNFVLLLYLPGEKAHAVNFIASGPRMALN